MFLISVDRMLESRTARATNIPGNHRNTQSDCLLAIRLNTSGLVSLYARRLENRDWRHVNRFENKREGTWYRTTHFAIPAVHFIGLISMIWYVFWNLESHNTDLDGCYVLGFAVAGGGLESRGGRAEGAGGVSAQARAGAGRAWNRTGRTRTQHHDPAGTLATMILCRYVSHHDPAGTLATMILQVR